MLKVLVLCLYLICAAVYMAAAQGKALARDSLQLKAVLQDIEQRQGVHFIYLDAVQINGNVGGFQYNSGRSLEENLAVLLSPLHLEASGVSASQYVIAVLKETGAAAKSADQVQGRVYASGTGAYLAGAVILVNGGRQQTISAADGRFGLVAMPGDTLSAFSAGYYIRTIIVGIPRLISIGLTPMLQALSETIIVGSRTPILRSKTETPDAVDILRANELLHTGRAGLAQMLQYSSPSFNTGQYGINNIAAVVDPVTLRGLGPDQMLVLVNGKRLHNTSGLNLNNTIGKGAAGTDLDALPVGAIAEAEILRDGAAAQYGSDAIAGVINLRLKTDTGGSFYTLVGATFQGDGRTAQTLLDYGIRAGRQGGFIHASLALEYRQPSDRGEAYTGLVYRAAADTAALNSILFPTPAAKQQENIRLDDSIVATRNFDRNAGVYGTSGLKHYALWINTGLPLRKGWKAYAFGGYSHRLELTYGFYRFPNDYRNTSPFFTDGYLPQFPTTVADGTFCAGIRREGRQGWNMDFSSTYGSNTITGFADHTVNASLGAASPQSFYLGKTIFSQSTTDANFSKAITGLRYVHSLGLALGTEARIDRYTILAGERASYIDANDTSLPPAARKQSGTNGRPGFTPANAISQSRFNLGVYAEADADVTKALLLSGAMRYEYYNDFGANISGKVSSRLRLGKTFALRGSVNRGFRAPSLQQIYYSQEQSQIFFKNGQAGLFKVQHFRNGDPLIRQLGVENLKPETSWNLAGGITATPGKKLLVTVDVYRIAIHNRIIVSGRLDSTVDAVKLLLAGTQNTDIQFFTNAVSTITQGIDIVAAYRERLPAHWGVLTINAGMTFSETKLQAGVSGIHVPAGSNIAPERLLTATDAGIIETAQPKSKAILTMQWQVRGWELLLRNTRFGSVAYKDANPALDQTFSGKIITDCSLSRIVFRRAHLTAGVNNIFNIYPDRVAEIPVLNTNLTSGGQVPYSRISTPFGFTGSSYYASVQFSF